MRLRITIEYDTDGQTIDQERQDWIDENVDFIDVWSLSDHDDSITIKFEAV